MLKNIYFKIKPMRKTILASLVIIFTTTAFFKFSSSTYSPRAAISRFEKSAKGSIDFFIKNRANQITGKIDLADVEKARQQISENASMRSMSALNLAWDEVGPDNIAGRTRAMLIDKDSSSVLYAGGVAGGLWKSSDDGAHWHVLFDDFEANTISCITQAINGDIYVGTGEGHYWFNGTGTAGMLGAGIYKSTNRGASFVRLASTIPSNQNLVSAAFTYVNELAASPSNPQRIYAASNKGLLVTLDGGNTWHSPITTADSTSVCDEVQVGSNDAVVVSFGGIAYLSPNGNDGTFVKISSGISGKLPLAGVSRIEFAFSPQDPNYIYACAASASSGDLYGVYKSINGGGFWSNIASPSADPLAPQGDYDNCITVSSQNKDRIYVGGTSLYTCLFTSSMITAQWTRISVQYPGSQDLYRYVHADLHVLVSAPNNSQVLYVATDGGIFKTTNALTAAAGGPAFSDLNNGYNITQFYAIAPTPNGDVVGGTQDNGTKHIITVGGTSQNAVSIGGGDGGYTEASFILPGAFFSTVYYGSLNRSLSGNSGSFYSPRIMALPDIYESGFASFVTPIALYENFNDSLSPDSVDYVIKPTDNLSVGGVLSIKSRVAGQNSQIKKYFNDTNKVSRTIGETIRVKDILQARIAVGFNNSVWLTKHALDESGPVNWLRIGYSQVADVNSRYFGMARILRFSKDGDYLYVGTFDGNLFRFSNLKSITYDDTLTGEIGNPACQIQCKRILQVSGRALTGVAIDPNNNNKIVVTFGNYGNTNYVYMSNNATDAVPSFSNLQNNLPAMPVFDALIDMNNSNTILLGTEYGVWASDNNGATWTQNTGIPFVPVLCLRQQLFSYSSTVYGTGIIYAGTHGRGVWKSNSLVSIKDLETANDKLDYKPIVFPNPAKEIVNVEFYVDKNQQGLIQVFTSQGKLVKTINVQNLVSGKNRLQFSVEDFEVGTYFVTICQNNKQSAAKFVVIK
jgi:hypothetical protein